MLAARLGFDAGHQSGLVKEPRVADATYPFRAQASSADRSGNSASLQEPAVLVLFGNGDDLVR